MNTSLIQLSRLRLTILHTLLILGCVLPASAQLTYTFEQTGFSGGGTISGGFTATDLNQDSFIYADPWGAPLDGYEVTDFHFSFTGDSLVPDFTSTSLGVLRFELNGENFLGDSPSEGLANNWFGGDGFMYAAGQGPTNTDGGVVIDLTTGLQSTTGQLVTVSVVTSGAVPEPSTYALVGAGLLSMLVARRVLRRKSGTS